MFRSTLLRQQRLLVPTTSKPFINAVPALMLRRSLGTIPQPPGGITGTVNDATPVPPVDKSHGSYHWAFEKIIVAGMVPLAVAPFTGITLSPVLDASLSTLILLHAHLGFESCITDYIPKRVYGKVNTAAMGALYAGTALSLYGIYELETNDIGFTAAVGKIWNA